VPHSAVLSVGFLWGKPPGLALVGFLWAAHAATAELKQPLESPERARHSMIAITGALLQSAIYCGVLSVNTDFRTSSGSGARTV
jgi:hypothetical protein